MEQLSQHSANVGLPEATLDGQVREMYGRVAYTHKTHEKMADRYTTRHRIFKSVEILLSAITTTSLLLAVFGDTHSGTVVGAVCSTILLGVTLYFKEASLAEKIQKHNEVASKLWAVREALLSLLVDLKDGRELAEVRQERDRFNAALEAIYGVAPRTDAAAYLAAQKALKDAEELFFTDEELDRMLPRQLRKSDS
ncbi:SLATT domain-containing protein [Burkholderia sp. BCC1972]|uniref:SLATT domain-containing protein n=1 Tax=Burkholderia sp. BCC1972 TaxID=2817438 RepID=UPI002ABDA456|nr:SLATT domain-containing protein [Burkholderia sp. BCC1972]